MSVTISKLRQLRGMGIFSDFQHSYGTPEFRRYNLVYGFNGSGKTTLSRVLHSIAITKLSPHLPPDGELSIDLSDGTNVKVGSLNCAISPLVLVFNQDFVDENLVWQDGAAKPVFYIGMEQAKTIKLLELLEARSKSRHAARADAEKDCKFKGAEFGAFKTDIGKLIAEELSLGRRYNATSVENDYQDFHPTIPHTLSEHERKVKKALINREAPDQDIIFQRHPSVSSWDAIKEALDICSITLGGVMIEALKNHPSMTGWVKTGLEYHFDHSLAECLHCGQPITVERIASLRSSFDAYYDDHVRDIESCVAMIVSRMEAFRVLSFSLPSGEIPADLVDQFSKSIAIVQDAERRCYAMLRAVEHGLRNKLKSPNLNAAVVLPESVRACSDLDAAINLNTAIIAEIVETHNKRNRDFIGEQAKARMELKLHHLSEGYQEYIKLRDEFYSASAMKNTRVYLSEIHTRRIAVVRGRLRSHGPAVETVNKLLKSFLGHGELGSGPIDLRGSI